MNNKAPMGRRDLLRFTALALGVSAVSPAVASAVLAKAEAPTSTEPKFLTPQQLLLVAVLTEMILPATSTPGANAAGVHHYIDTLLGGYFSNAHRRRFMRGLAEVDSLAKAEGFPDFARADTETQLAIARSLDKQAYKSHARSDIERTPFFRELKELTLIGYYTSEIGATRELAYQPIPGQYKGCVPYADLGRAWAT